MPHGRQEALEVLSGRYQQSLPSDVGQPAQQEAPHLGPRLGLATQRLDPHLALAQRLLVRRRRLLLPGQLAVVLVKGPVECPRRTTRLRVRGRSGQRVA